MPWKTSQWWNAIKSTKQSEEKQGFFEEGLICYMNIKYLCKFSPARPEVSVQLEVSGGCM